MVENVSLPGGEGVKRKSQTFGAKGFSTDVEGLRAVAVVAVSSSRDMPGGWWVRRRERVLRPSLFLITGLRGASCKHHRPQSGCATSMGRGPPTAAGSGTVGRRPL